MADDSNLKRYSGVDLKSSGQNADNDCCIEDDGRFFDSSDYRCCFSIFHAKIGTFVFCTWIFHEIVLATLYLISRDEFKDSDWNTWMIILLACRLIQIPTVGILYVGLWRHRRFLLLPFAVVQLTLGTFADISTLMLVLADMEASSNNWMLFDSELAWMNIALPLFFYALLLAALLWVLYRCFVFLRARTAHEKKRQVVKSREMKCFSPKISNLSVTPSVSTARKLDEQQNESLI